MTPPQPHPLPEPVPHPDCTACADWARLRERHRAVDDQSGVTDCNVMLRRHRALNDHSGGPRPLR